MGWNFYSWLYGEGVGKETLDGTDADWREEEHPRGRPDNKGQFRQGVKSITRQDELDSGWKDGDGTITLPNGRKVDESLKSLYTDDKGKLLDHKFSPFLKKMGGDGSVSEEMDSVLDRLFSGEDVPDNEIEAIPEWKEANDRAREDEDVLKRKRGVSKTSDIGTKERNKLRMAIVDAALSDRIGKTVPVEGQDGLRFETNEGLKDGEEYEVDRGRKAFVCIGFPAAGKSTTFANPLAKEHKARLCDSDTIKKVLPEFDNGYGGSLVHEESTILNEQVLGVAAGRGDNIVYPILGYKKDMLKGVIDAFHKEGYKVSLCFKDMPRPMAKGRLLVRFLQKGRYLPLECISKVGDGLKESFEANKGLADAYKRTTNDKPYGGEERTIEEKGEI